VRRAKQAGLDLAPAVLDGVDAYLAELSHWNARINLTAFRLGDDPTDEAVDRLVVEPLVAARFIPPSVREVIDVGSGGGSPAVPIKIARADLRLTMVEVKVRKSAFLRQVSRRLELKDTVVENVRVEELLTRPEMHGRFHAATARAVRLAPSLWQVLQSLLMPGGLVLHFTGAGRAPASMPPFQAQAVHTLLPQGSVLSVSQKLDGGRRFT
jgi:16S rRNA (guanine527-N7)-methyltransferase